jgi:hypothetical protein
MPFHDRSELRASNDILNGVRPPRPAIQIIGTNELSDSVWDVISRCWSPEPTSRPEIVDVFNSFTYWYQQLFVDTSAEMSKAIAENNLLILQELVEHRPTTSNMITTGISSLLR